MQYNTTLTMGEITLITGPMFAGKTTELLRQLNVHKNAGQKCLLIKHASDTRYSARGEVTTHDGISAEATIICKSLTNMSDKDMAQCRASQVIGIDEGQFFDDLVEFCDTLACGKKLIVAGLCTTHERANFKPVADLFPFSEKIIRLRAICKDCSKPADYTFRTGKIEASYVGGLDDYKALCRSCYFRNQGLRSNSLI